MSSRRARTCRHGGQGRVVTAGKDVSSRRARTCRHGGQGRACRHGEQGRVVMAGKDVVERCVPSTASPRQNFSPRSSSLGRKAGRAFAKAPFWQFRSHLATELIT